MIPSILVLRSTNPGGLILWCVIGLCAGLYLFFQGFRLLQRRRLILDTPVSKIRSASMGMVELSGLAVGPYTMVAPITARPCYYYRTFAWEWKQSGKNKQWVKVAAECMHVPFFLDDNTGTVMVDPRGADLDLHRDFQQEFCDGFFTTKEEAPPNVHMFLSRHGVSTTNKIKVEEFCIKPKNSLFLLGTLDENPDLEITSQPIRDDEATSLVTGNAFSFSIDGPQLGQAALSFATGAVNTFRSEPLIAQPSADSIADRTGGIGLGRGSSSAAIPQVIRLTPDAAPTKSAEMTQQQRVAAALLRAGISSPAAWAAAQVTPDGVATNPSSPPDGFDTHPPVVLRKGANNPTFLISWRSQRDVARSLAWKCTLMIWGGPALALLCLYALLAFSHLL
ncbi:MAG TPA: GIDE domain-containing protein [Candidatus Sulfotelmatobacter sp.]|nr:GIDE domain-containing protein [Candidatus Sulfotelmatobacter sp.]